MDDDQNQVEAAAEDTDETRPAKNLKELEARNRRAFAKLAENQKQLDEGLGAMSTKLDAFMEALLANPNATRQAEDEPPRERIQALDPTKRQPVVENRHLVSTAEMDDVNASGMAKFRQGKIPAIERTRFKSVDSPDYKEWAANMAFMEEMVTFEVNTSNDPSFPARIPIYGNDGHEFVVEPGKQYTLPRRYLDCLARARPVNFRNEEYAEPDGTRGYRYPMARGHRYPVAVINDTPRGRAWLRAINNEP